MQATQISRRNFVSGAALALGYLGLRPDPLLAGEGAARWLGRYPQQAYDYDSYAKINFNENPWGPSPSAMEAMSGAWKYANRYGYPDDGIQDVIAQRHGVPRENILMGAGSEEILRVVGLTYLRDRTRVVGVEPSYGSVYEHATGIKADPVLIPLLGDSRQDIPAMVRATNRNYRDIGFVYLCNPNNPTGITVTADEVRQVLDGIPEDIPVLIDEAYHHFVEDPAYETSVPYVLEGRKVIVARTFSKIFGMAGLRLGYAVAPADMVREMSPHLTGSVNALVKWGGAQALRDAEAEAEVRGKTIEFKRDVIAQVQDHGYEVLPSHTNFFMMHTGRPVREVGRDFREKGVLVGRPFPPMLDYLRVSIGTREEMDRFLVAFHDIFPARRSAASSRGG